MHGSIRHELEGLLEGNDTGSSARHLASCGECAGEVAAMRTQNNLFRSLKSAEDVEPMAGFYARVMQRIEDKAKDSIWAFFVYSSFRKRLAYASLSITLALGTYMVAQEKLDGDLTTETASTEQAHYDVPVEGNQAQQRDAVLQNFAAHPVSLKR